ncbi:hypothetical protein A2U01_0006436, partial [Trifolium medium]|nr:hypothetical protein [Trifolium medium]
MGQGKWVWKIRAKRHGLWYKALLDRYGVSDGIITEGGGGCSSWWKSICQLELGREELSNSYSVKEEYKKIMEDDLSHDNSHWVKVWHKSIPSKVCCLVWRIVQNRVATKNNLVRRGVLFGVESSHWVGWCGAEESVSHLFFECPIFAGVWYSICNWMKISSALQNGCVAQLEQFEGLIGSGRAFTNRVSVIWFACMWSIWKARNDKVFNNKDICLDSIVESVKRCSWNWLNIKSHSIDYSISQCCWLIRCGSLNFFCTSFGSLVVSLGNLWHFSALKILVCEALELKKISLLFFENSVAVNGMGRGPKIAALCSVLYFLTVVEFFVTQNSTHCIFLPFKNGTEERCGSSKSTVAITRRFGSKTLRGLHARVSLLRSLFFSIAVSFSPTCLGSSGFGGK